MSTLAVSPGGSRVVPGRRAPPTPARAVRAPDPLASSRSPRDRQRSVGPTVGDPSPSSRARADGDDDGPVASTPPTDGNVDARETLASAPRRMPTRRTPPSTSSTSSSAASRSAPP